MIRAEESVNSAKAAERKGKEKYSSAISRSVNNSASSIDLLKISNSSIFSIEDKEKKSETLFLHLESNRKRVEQIYIENILPSVLAVIILYSCLTFEGYERS